MRGLRARLGGLVRAAFGVVGLAFLVGAFLRTWDRSRGLAMPPWPLLLGALACVVAGLVLALLAWAILLRTAPTGDDGEDLAVSPRAVAPGFFLAQLGKYVPGAVWQAVGQIGYATRADVSVGRASVSFLVFGLTQAAAGGLVGAATGLLAPDLPGLLRLATAGGLALLVLLHRGWVVRAVRLARRSRPPEEAHRLVPGQRAIARSVGFSTVVMVLAGVAFALLLAGTAPGVGFVPAAVPAFCLAWVVGFLALPFPAGLGVREAVLMATLGPAAPVAAIIAASVALRLVFMAGELLCIAVTRAGPLAAPASAPSGRAQPAPERRGASRAGGR